MEKQTHVQTANITLKNIQIKSWQSVPLNFLDRISISDKTVY